MVRLPARLTSKLAKARIAQLFSSAPPGPMVHCVDPADVLHPGSAAPVSREKMQVLIENPCPVIWICGSEPLLHSGIGHFVRAIAQSGHYVFLETDGAFLRRRIHEFQPVRELFLVVRLNSLEAPESALAIEGLGAARLSGFFTVIHSQVHDDSDLVKLTTFPSFIKTKDVDGWLITAASSEELVVRKALEARALIHSNFWCQFSENIEEALLSQVPAKGLHDEQAFDSADVHTEAGEESVRIA